MHKRLSTLFYIVTIIPLVMTLGLVTACNSTSQAQLPPSDVASPTALSGKDNSQPSTGVFPAPTLEMTKESTQTTATQAFLTPNTPPNSPTAIPLPPSGNWTIQPDHLSELEQLSEVKPALIGVPYDLAWSPDGSLLAAVGPAGITLLNGETLAVIQSLQNASTFSRVSFSADGRYLAATGSASRVSQVWDTTTGQSLWTLTDTGTFSSISPDGKILATIEDELQYTASDQPGSLKTTLKRYNLETGDLVGSTSSNVALSIWVENQPETIGMIFSPDGSRIQTINSLGDVTIWNRANGNLINTSINAYTRQRLSSGQCMVDDTGITGFGVLCDILYFDPPCTEDNANCNPTVKRRYELGMWDARQTKRLRNLVINDPDVLYREMAISIGDNLAALLTESSLEIWDARHPEAVQQRHDKETLPDWLARMQDCSNCYMPIMAMKPNRAGAVTAISYQNHLALWDISSNQILAEWQHDTHMATAAAFGSIDSQTVAAIGYSDGSLSVLNLATGQSTAVSQDGQTERILHLAVAQDGNTLISARDGALEWRSIESAELAHTEEFDKNDIFLPNLATGALVASFNRYEGVLSLHDLTTGVIRQTWKESIYLAAISQDGHWLVSGKSGVISLYNLQDGKQRFSTPLSRDFNSMRAIAISPEGSLLAVSLYDKSLIVFETNSSEIWFESTLQTGIRQVAFHPMGCLLAFGDSDGLIQILDLTTRQIVYHFQAHTGPIESLEFNQNGSLLLSIGSDGAVRVWGQAGALSVPDHISNASPCPLSSTPHPMTPTPTTQITLPPTADTAAVELTRTLSLTTPNMTGNDVLQLQQRLFELGYTQVGIPDGVFGPKTDLAVRQYQKQNGLVVDGMVGPITWEKLFTQAP